VDPLLRNRLAPLKGNQVDPLLRNRVDPISGNFAHGQALLLEIMSRQVKKKEQNGDREIRHSGNF
jgi:hypothetical protein